MNVEIKLKELMLKKGGDLKNFCKSINIADSTLRSALYKENGYKNMRAENLFVICDALNIDMIELLRNEKIKEATISNFKLTQKEYELIRKYRKLDTFGIRAVDETLSVETDRNIYYENETKYIFKPCLEQSAAAGVGVDFDTTDYELVRIARDKISEICDFIIKVNGDSMKPDYPDGSFVMVRQFQPVNIGEVGIFQYQGEIFIKELGEKSLVSKNPQYEPILINDFDRFTLLGKVIGTAEVKL